MEQIIKTILIIALAGGVGAFLGFFAIWFFNKMPAKWLCDYGQEPAGKLAQELDNPGTQRIKTYPWKYVIVAFMSLCAIYLSQTDLSWAMGGIMAIWALLLMAIADYKYMIVPDQLVLVLLLSAIGFMPHYINYKEPLFGGLIAFGVLALMALIGKLVYKKYVIGGGDIKVYAAIGVIAGWRGFLIIFVMATLISALNYAIMLAKKKIAKGDERPMIPYIFAATVIYLLFLEPFTYQIWL